MTWTVDIHHIDIGSIGDSTVIDVRFPGGPAGAAIRRTVLIDGGKANAAPIVDAYLHSIGVNQVNVIIITHFDEDHFYGISRLLQGTVGTPARYQHAKLYDMGRLPGDRDEREYRDPHNKRQYVPTEYANYRNAISAMPGTFTHATARVNSFDIVSWHPGTGAAVAPGILTRVIGGGGARNYQIPHWLLDKDLLWGNGESGLGGGAAWTVQAPAAYAPNRPVLRCISANKWVLQPNGTAQYCSDARVTFGESQDSVADAENANDNAKSLGFVLEFNNFRYYVAGDLEQPQEDGHVNRNEAAGVVQQGAKFRLNQPDTMPGRVHAMKASHHGAETASSRTFITRLRPGAVFISSGRGNKFKHPAQRTINVLDGYPEEPALFDPNSRKRHPPTPPPPPVRAVQHYLTGYQDPVLLLALGGDASQTAGDPAVPTPGHIRLTVTEAESLRDPAGQTYRGTRAALEHATAGLGLPAPAAALLDSVADASATHGAARAVATLLGLPALTANTALVGTALMGDDQLGGLARDGIATAAVNAAAGGAVAVVAAMGPYGARIAGFGPGAAAAIAAAVTAPAAGLTAAVVAAAVGGGATAGAAAAAGAVADAVFAETGQRDDAAYAVGIALFTVNGGGGVTPEQAATIAAAIMVTVADARAGQAARIVVTAARHAVLPAQLPLADAAQAGAVASAAYYLGVPDRVERGVRKALVAAGGAVAAAAPHAAAAQAAATLNPDNRLFTVTYTSVHGAQIVPHAD